MELLYLAIGMLIGGVITGLFLFSKKSKQDTKVEILISELQKREAELNIEREKYTTSQSEISKLDTVNLNLQEGFIGAFIYSCSRRLLILTKYCIFLYIINKFN